MGMPELEIYSMIGAEGFGRLVAAFYRQVPLDDLLGPIYPASDLPGAEQRLRDLLRELGTEGVLFRELHARVCGSSPQSPPDHDCEYDESPSAPDRQSSRSTWRDRRQRIPGRSNHHVLLRNLPRAESRPRPRSNYEEDRSLHAVDSGKGMNVAFDEVAGKRHNLIGVVGLVNLGI